MVGYKRLSLISCLAAVFILPAEANQPASVSSESQGIELLRIVVLDVSGSMSQADVTAASRLDTARKEIRQAFTQLPVSSKNPAIMVPFSERVRDGSDRIYTNPREFNEAVAKLDPNGQTNIAAGLSKSIEWANRLLPARHLVVYLFSDGENNIGSPQMVREQEDKLDKLFGLRASKGLSQTVVVKRWGGVIGSIVARLEKNPNVAVVDAGQLELRTVTLVPSVAVRDVGWQDVTSWLAKIHLDVTIVSRGQQALPPQARVTLGCPLDGCRWLSEPYMAVSKAIQTQSFSLLVRLDPKKFTPGQRYAIPLQFDGPSQLRTDKSIILVVINPKEVTCDLPAGQLRPKFDVSAKLLERGNPRWEDLDQRTALWPMRLHLETGTTAPIPWSEQIRWDIRGLGGVQVASDRPILLGGPSTEVNVNLTMKVSLEQIVQGKPISVKVELSAVSEPKTVILSSMRILLTVQIRPPAVQSTLIEQKVSHIGKPQWADLTMGLVTVPVKLDISFKGMLAPKTVLHLVPCNDVVGVEGVPVTVYSGRQTVDITLTGRVRSVCAAVRWPLQLKAPPPSFGICYIEPPPVEVSFVAPGPVQAVLCSDGGVLTHYACRGSKPDQPIVGHAYVKLAGQPICEGASKNLRIMGLLQDPMGGSGFSAAGPGQWASWSMRPNDPASSVKWWRDTVVQGSLVTLPENAASGVVLGSILPMTITYEAIYKRMVFYLAVGLAAVLLGTLLFWMLKTALGDTYQA